MVWYSIICIAGEEEEVPEPPIPKHAVRPEYVCCAWTLGPFPFRILEHPHCLTLVTRWSLPDTYYYGTIKWYSLVSHWWYSSCHASASHHLEAASYVCVFRCSGRASEQRKTSTCIELRLDGSDLDVRDCVVPDLNIGDKPGTSSERRRRNLNYENEKS